MNVLFAIAFVFAVGQHYDQGVQEHRLSEVNVQHGLNGVEQVAQRHAGPGGLVR